MFYDNEMIEVKLDKDNNLVDDYFKKFNFFKEKYGEIILFYEVGSFMELYGVENEEITLGNVKEISQILNIQMTRRNKAITENSIKNPLMAGIPTISFKRFLDSLIRLNKYTIIIVNQITEPPNPERRVTEIISPGTNIDNLNKDNSNLISIFIQEETNKNFAIGCSCIDVSTGKSLVYETFSIKNDNLYAFNEAERFIKSNYPKEIIVNCNNLKTLTNDDIINKLGLFNVVCHINISNLNKEMLKINYQEQLLSTIFKNNTFLTYSELLNLERKQFALNSYIFLLKFVYEHNPLIINKIYHPEILEEEKYLNLANNAIFQLNLISRDDYVSNDITSIFNVINNTSTSLGSRLLKFKLLNPIIDVNELNKQYNDIELMIPNYKEIESELTKIYDIERLHRKLVLKKLNPCDFTLLNLSYESILKINKICNDNKKLNINDNFLLNKKVLLKFENFIKEYKKIFDINEMYKHNINDINGNFFNKGVNESVDVILNEIEKNNEIFNFILNYFNEVSGNNEFKIMNTDKEGYYIYITNNKYKDFEKNLLNYDFKIDLSNYSNLKFKSSLIYGIKDIEVKTLKNNKKITLNIFNEISDNIILLSTKLYKILKEEYLNYLEVFTEKYEEIFTELTKYVSYIDVVKSNAKTALINNYVKPVIENNSTSFINVENLRHPLVEKLNINNKYITNDICLGNNTLNKGGNSLEGILLFGLNASGKSTLMKSLGVSIVMAQSGMFVPCSKMVYFPFYKIFTRISGEDNLFKGLSSFAVEMSELRNILKNSDSNTLVLGDEISHGTETISGVSIVASALINLSEVRSKFLFATHLHELSDLSEINDIKTLKKFHLEVKYDENSDTLVYNRKLKEGSGSSVYGLEVAKAMDLDKSFIKKAYEIRKKIIKQHNITKQDLLMNNIKKSNYNNNLYMEKCFFCENNAEHTHHIIEQKKANLEGFVENIHKNHKSNLIPLCEKHHIELHKILLSNNDLVSENGLKWLETSTGSKLWINPKLKELLEVEIKDKLISF